MTQKWFVKTGTGRNNIQVHVDKGKVVEISGQWKQQRDSKANDWRCGHWWEHGYVRRLEMPEDADWRNIEAYIYNETFLEIRIPKSQHGCDLPQGKAVAWAWITGRATRVSLLPSSSNLCANWYQTFNKVITLLSLNLISVSMSRPSGDVIYRYKKEGNKNKIIVYKMQCIFQKNIRAVYHLLFDWQ